MHFSLKKMVLCQIVLVEQKLSKIVELGIKMENFRFVSSSFMLKRGTSPISCLNESRPRLSTWP
jgi:cephalosporin hydroxylase